MRLPCRRLAGALTHESLQLCRGQGCAQVVSLGLVAVVGAQKIELLLGLHALGRGAHAQGLGHADDGADDGPVVGVVAQVADEGLVDLELVDLKALELAQ